MPVNRGTTRAYLGVFLGDPPETQASSGVIVGKVVPDSPAARAGLQINDVLLRFNQTELANAAHVHQLLGDLVPGTHLQVTFLRGSERQTVEVVLGERQARVDICKRLYAEAENSEVEAAKYRQLAEEERRRGNEEEARKRLAEAGEFAKQAAIYREEVDKAIREGTAKGAENCQGSNRAPRQAFGLITVPLTEQLAQFFKVPGGTGVLVSEIKPGSPAERSGLKVGDCLHAINGQPVSVPAEVNRLLNPATSFITRTATSAVVKNEITLALVRAGQSLTLTIDPLK